MSGSLAVPNLIGAQPGPTIQAALFDQNWAAQNAYINTREVTFGLLAARPAAGVAGRYYMATDQNGGTYYGDNGSAWVQLSPGVTQLTPTSANYVVLNDVTQVSISDVAAFETITSVSTTVPISSLVTVSVSLLAQSSGGSTQGSLRLSAGSGVTPPQLGSLRPLHNLVQGGAWVWDTWLLDASTTSTGGAFTVLLAGFIEAGSNGAQFGAGVDPRFQRTIVIQWT